MTLVEDRLRGWDMTNKGGGLNVDRFHDPLCPYKAPSNTLAALGMRLQGCKQVDP